MSEEYVSLNPETFTEGGGLVDDSDAVFTDFRWVLADLSLLRNGMDPTSGGNRQPYLTCKMDVGGEEYVNWWSAGRADFFEPSQDGKSLKAKSTAKGINSKSKVGIFLASVFNAGFPKDRLGSDITVLNGLEGHFNRVPTPEYKGLAQAKKENDPGIITITKINKLPWEKAGKGKAGGSKPKASAPAASDGLDEEIANMILIALSENPEGVPKKDLIKLVVSEVDSAKKSGALKYVNSDEWLKERSEWAFEDGVVRLP